jgi:hypothetical protein
MAEHLPYYGHEQGCYNSKIPWGPEPCPGCVALRRAFSQGQRDERKRVVLIVENYYKVAPKAAEKLLSLIKETETS